jgi:hypothetical protein
VRQATFEDPKEAEKRRAYREPGPHEPNDERPYIRPSPFWEDYDEQQAYEAAARDLCHGAVHGVSGTIERLKAIAAKAQQKLAPLPAQQSIEEEVAPWERKS